MKSDTIIGGMRSIVERGRFGAISDINRAGDPAQEILDTAASLGADIVAVGSRGRGGVSRHLLNHAECSVLICKQ